MASGKSKDGEDNMSEIAGKMWQFLDKLALEKPEEYKKFIEQQLEEGRSIVTPPEPVYCMQCQVRAWEVTCSLYINVCKWIRVPKPSDQQAPVPVKGGVLRYLIDERTKLKTASKDLVFDVAFNPDVIEECTRDSIMDLTLVSLILQYVEQMTDLRFIDKNHKKIKALFKGPKADLQHSLDEHWSHLLTPESKLDIGHSLLKQLHSLKTNGSSDSSKPLPPLILRSDKPKQHSTTNGSSDSTTQKKRLIEEIGSEQPTSSTDSRPRGKNLKEKRLCTPAHSVVVREPDSKHPGRTVIVKVTLPGVSSADQVDLEVAKNDLQLTVHQRYYLSLQLPTPVNNDTTRAKFSSKNSVLTISMPCL